jgi:hypothetical protein
MRFIIPVIKDDEWKDLPSKALKKTALQYFRKHLAGKEVYNRDKSIKVKLAMSGAVHAAWARKGGYEKMIIFKALPEIIENGRFVNWEPAKPKHPVSTIGFLRFSSLAIVNGVKRRYTFDIRIDKGGKYYYDHNVFVKKD